MSNACLQRMEGAGVGSRVGLRVGRGVGTGIGADNGQTVMDGAGEMDGRGVGREDVIGVGVGCAYTTP
jgi:hypothetical protein